MAECNIFKLTFGTEKMKDELSKVSPKLKNVSHSRPTVNAKNEVDLGRTYSIELASSTWAERKKLLRLHLKSAADSNRESKTSINDYKTQILEGSLISNLPIINEKDEETILRKSQEFSLDVYGTRNDSKCRELDQAQLTITSEKTPLALIFETEQNHNISKALPRLPGQYSIQNGPNNYEFCKMQEKLGSSQIISKNRSNRTVSDLDFGSTFDSHHVHQSIRIYRKQAINNLEKCCLPHFRGDSVLTVPKLPENTDDVIKTSPNVLPSNIHLEYSTYGDVTDSPEYEDFIVDNEYENVQEDSSIQEGRNDNFEVEASSSTVKTSSTELEDAREITEDFNDADRLEKEIYEQYLQGEPDDTFFTSDRNSKNYTSGVDSNSNRPNDETDNHNISLLEDKKASSPEIYFKPESSDQGPSYLKENISGEKYDVLILNPSEKLPAHSSNLDNSNRDNCNETSEARSLRFNDREDTNKLEEDLKKLYLIRRSQSDLNSWIYRMASRKGAIDSCDKIDYTGLELKLFH